MAARFDPRAVSWELGTTKLDYVTQAQDSFMSEERNQIVRQAIMDRKEPESLQLGKFLRKSNVTLSMRQDPVPSQSEAKSRWTTPAKIEQGKSYAEIRIAELRKKNIDLGVADSKSGKEWTSVLKAVHSAHADKKFACEKPKADVQLMEDLRKSSVLLHAGRHDFRSSSVPVPRTTSSNAFCAKPIERTENFNHLGEEARTSSFEYSYGTLESKAGKDWQSQQHDVMSTENDKKWNCKQPAGFYHLIAELKKSNVTLGSDRLEYGTEGNKRPVRDDRNARAAGADRGL